MTTTAPGPKYRPSRIQTLTAEQEIILKQVWAYIFKYLGYPLDISNSDITYKESFIASTSTQHFDDSQTIAPLVRVNTRASVTSKNTTTSNRRSLWSGNTKKGKEDNKSTMGGNAGSSLPYDSKRMVQIQTQSSLERYVPVDVASDEFYYILAHHYKGAFEYTEDAKLGKGHSDYNYNGSIVEQVFDDDIDSDYSVESFVTAATSFTDDVGHKSSNGTMSRKESIAYNGGRIRIPGKGSKKSHTTSRTTVKSKANSHVHVSTIDQFNRTMDMQYTVRSDPSPLKSFSRYHARDIHKALQKLGRQDLFDNFILKFVRARKWDTHKALDMLMKSLDWRINEFQCDDWVFEGDAVSYLNSTNEGFIKNFTKEKSWVKGRDKNNNTIFTFQARKHLTSDASAPQNQRYALVMIEWIRFFLKDVSESVDNVTIVFDLTGFSLKNADYSTIKFLADCLEAHYPETLGFILIHNAPWIFSTVWNIIKGWLDPAVASKIHFTKNVQELSRYIDMKLIPDYLGGEDATRGHYPIPTEIDLVPPKAKDAEFVRLKKERDQLYCRFYETTKKWIESTNPAVSELYLKDKLALNIELSKNYCLLDPYIRNRGIYDRDGTLVVVP
ncbi:Phosphatidylinositol transfer protein CSR1 [Spathaspora sp. JA1]|nr:Phosphatidylinositol transfer protein CSR1 [Spathaspora sp. JA1]